MIFPAHAVGRDLRLEVYSPKNGITFSVDSYFPSLKAANDVLERAGIGAIIRPERD